MKEKTFIRKRSRASRKKKSFEKSEKLIKKKGRVKMEEKLESLGAVHTQMF